MSTRWASLLGGGNRRLRHVCRVIVSRRRRAHRLGRSSLSSLPEANTWLGTRVRSNTANTQHDRTWYVTRRTWCVTAIRVVTAHPSAPRPAAQRSPPRMTSNHNTCDSPRQARLARTTDYHDNGRGGHGCTLASRRLLRVVHVADGPLRLRWDPSRSPRDPVPRAAAAPITTFNFFLSRFLLGSLDGCA